MSVDEDFADFVRARWSSLYRLAYLLAASPTGAEDLLQTTLEKAYVNWRRIGQMEYPEAYVRRMLANTLVSSRRRAWHRERPTDTLPEVAGDSAEMPVLDRSLLWPLVCALPDRQRAVIVLRYYEDLSEAQIAEALGCAPGTVKSQASSGDRGAPSSRGRGGRGRGGGRVMTLGDQLRAVLSQEADMQYATPPDVDRLIIGGRQRRRHRNLARAGGAALALVLVGGGAYAVTPGRRRRPGLAGSRTSRRRRPSRRGPRPRRPCRRTPAAGDLEPGTYRVLVGADAGGLPDRGGPDLRGPGLECRELPDCCRTPRASAGSVSTSPCALAAGSGCSGDARRPPTWARARGPSRSSSPSCRGARSLQPVEPTEVLGRYAVHLRLRIPETCPMRQYYRVAETPRAVAASATTGQTRPCHRSSWTSGSSTWTATRSSSTRGTRSARRQSLVDKVARAAESITLRDGP